MATRPHNCNELRKTRKTLYSKFLAASAAGKRRIGPQIARVDKLLEACVRPLRPKHR